MAAPEGGANPVLQVAAGPGAALAGGVVNEPDHELAVAKESFGGEIRGPNESELITGLQRGQTGLGVELGVNESVPSSSGSSASVMPKSLRRGARVI